MKKTRFMSVMALTAMIGTTTAAPVFAAETATGGTDVVYTANSAAPDNADWLVSYPKQIVLSDFNTTPELGVALNFKLLDKQTSNDYLGTRTVGVSVADYDNGFAMTGSGTGAATMGIAADTTKAELTSTQKVIGEMKAKATGTENARTGWAYLKNTTDPVGTFTYKVTFTFTDDSVQ